METQSERPEYMQSFSPNTNEYSDVASAYGGDDAEYIPDDENTHNRRMGDAMGSQELIVLDPTHPLMRSFQECLRKMLLKHLENAEVIMREKDEEFKREKTIHVETGCELFTFQHELARFQVQMEKKHSEYLKIVEQAEAVQLQLKELREQYQSCVQGLNEDTKTMQTMRNEVDTLCLRLFYLNNAKEEVLGDIKVMQRAAEKANTDLAKHENEKMRQDMLIDRIQTKVDQLKEDIALYEAQIVAQEAEMDASQTLLHEAEAQIITINADRKHLMSQWNSSLLGLQRRNEAYAALTKAYNELQENLLVLENEQVAYRRLINKQQEKHEQLTVLVNKNEADLNSVKKQILQSQTKHEADKETYSSFSRMLQETERNLSEAQNDLNNQLANLESIRKQIEKASQKKTDLDGKINAELRDKLTSKKSMKYVHKLNLIVQDQNRELLTQIAEMENKIAKDELAAAVRKAENQRLKERIEEIEGEINERNVLINKLEAEIHHAGVMVERKQSAIDQLNKKLERLLHESGGIELGPLEVTIVNLTKSVQAKQEEIEELEQQWLREQNELVQQTNERDVLSKTVERLQKQLTILSQKKLRIDNEIAVQEREKAELERELKHLQNDTVRLNFMIAKEKSAGNNLSQENKLAEMDFVRALREKEIETTELQMKVEKMQKEMEDMLNDLVETERTIMLWEKKVQLCEETKHAVECDLGQGEMKVMRHEIHRMEVRKNSLLQQQEKLIQALERTVSKRDLIILQSETQLTHRNRAQMRIAAQRQLEEMKKKLKATKQLAKTCTSEIAELETRLQEVQNQIADKKSEFETEQNNVDQLSEKLQSLLEEKQKYVFETQLKQHETVYWEQVNEGRYRRLCQSSNAINTETNRQLNRMRNLVILIEKLIQDFPKIQRDLAPVKEILTARIEAEENKADTEPVPASNKRVSRRKSKGANDDTSRRPSQ